MASGGQRSPLTLSNGYLRTVANPAGNTVTLAYKPNGLLISLTDPRGGISQFLYDDDGRLTQDTNAAGRVVNLSRLEQPGLTSVTLTTGLDEATTYATAVLDNGNRQRSVLAPDGSTRTLTIGEGSVWTLNNADGSVERVTYAPDPRWGMNVPLAASVVITTPANVQWQMTTPGNPFSLDSSGSLAAVGQTYDNRGRLTTITQSSRITQFVYNSANWITSLTEPDGKITTMVHDVAGRITSATLPGNRVIALGYDANSNLTSLTPPGRTAHTFTYAADNQLTRYTPPTTVSGGGSSQWTYNSDRNVTAYTRPGSSVTMGYLNDGYQLGSITLARDVRSQTFDTAGRLETVNDPSGIGLSYTYDGPLLTSRTQSGSAAGMVGFA